MNRSTHFNRFLAVACAVILMMCSLGIQTFAGSETTFRDVTFSDFDFESTTYNESYCVVKDLPESVGLNGIAFNGEVRFHSQGTNPVSTGIFIGGKNQWASFILCYHDGAINFYDNINGTYVHLGSVSATTEELMDFRITFEYVGTSDVKVTCTVKGTELCNQTFAGYQSEMHDHLMINTNDTKLTVNSVIPQSPDTPGGTAFTDMSFSNFSFADETYNENYCTVKDLPEIVGLNGIAFNGKVRFHAQGANPVNTGVFIGGKNQWASFILCYHDGAVNFYDNVNGTYAHLGSVSASTEELVDFRIAFEYIGTEDVKVTCTVKGTELCNRTFTGYQSEMHDHLLINTNDTKITLNSVIPQKPEEPEVTFTELTFSHFGVDDGKYDPVRDVKGTAAITNLDKIAFTGYVTYTEGTNPINNTVRIGGNEESHWYGLNVCYADAGIYLFNQLPSGGDVDLAYVANSTLDMDPTTTPVKVRLTFEYVTNSTNVKVTFSLNDTKYYEGILTGAQQELGIHMLVAATTAPITIGSFPAGEPDNPDGPNNPDEPEIVYKEYSFFDFGVNDKTYPESYTKTTENPEIEGIDRVAISGKVQFHKQGSNPLNTGIFIGGKNQWAAFVLTYQDGAIQLYDNVNGTYTPLGSVEATTEEMVQVRMTFAYVGTSDVKVACKVKDAELCNQTFAGYQEFMHDHVLINTNDTTITVDSEGNDITKPELQKVTLKELGIQNKIYKYVKGVVSVSGEYTDSLLNTSMTHKITFSNHTGNRLTYGGGESIWHGIRLITNANNGEIGVDCTDAPEAYSISPKETGVALLGEEIELTLEVFECEENPGDVMLGVYINGALYENKYMKFSNAADKIGKFVSIYIPDENGSIKTGEPEPAPTLNQNFKRITFNSYGVISGTYGYNDGNFALQGNCKLDSLDGVIFSDTVHFSKEPGAQLRIGGKDTAWEGIVLYSMIDGMLQIMDTYDGFTPITFYPAIAGMNLTGQDIELTMSFEYVDYDEDGKKDDVKLGVWFNGKPYADSWIYLKNKAPELGRYMMIYSASKDSSVTLMTYTPPVDFKEFGFTANWAVELGLKKR